MPIKLTNEVIIAAIEGFEAQKARIDAKLSELRGLLTGSAIEAATTPEIIAPKRKKFSAAARKRMREAQQRRWANIKSDSEQLTQATPESSKPKRRLSAAGRKAIVAATKKRWALKRAEAAKGTIATKKVASARESAAGKKVPAKAVVRPAAQKGAAEKSPAPPT